MAGCAKAASPLAYEAFEEHVLNGVRFSRKECVATGRLLKAGEAELKGRNLAIFEGKLEKINSSVPIEEPDEPVLPSKS